MIALISSFFVIPRSFRDKKIKMSKNRTTKDYQTFTATLQATLHSGTKMPAVKLANHIQATDQLAPNNANGYDNSFPANCETWQRRPDPGHHSDPTPPALPGQACAHTYSYEEARAHREDMRSFCHFPVYHMNQFDISQFAMVGSP